MPRQHRDAATHEPAERRAPAASGSQDRNHVLLWRVVAGAIATLVVALLGVAIVVLPWDQVGLALKSADPGLLALALVASLGIYPLWVWQWRHIAAPLRVIRWPAMAQIVALSIGARFAVSGLGGVASGGAALHARGGLSLAEAAGVMTVDQALAGGTKLIVLAVALAIIPAPPAVRTAALALAVALVFAGVLLAGLAWFGRPPRLASTNRPVAAMTRFARNFARLGTVRVLVPAALLALTKKGLEVAAAYAIQRSLGIDGSPALAILAVASISLVSLLPLAPVQLGPQALAVFTTYAAFGTPTAEAISVAALHQAILLLSTLIIGAAAVAVATRPTRANPAP